MERLLLLWDELDDFTGLFRHVAASTADELVTLAAPLVTAASTLGAGLLALNWYAHAALISGAAAPWIA